jgi:hypothetical protein
LLTAAPRRGSFETLEATWASLNIATGAKMEMEMKQTLIGIVKFICFIAWAILTVGIYGFTIYLAYLTGFVALILTIIFRGMAKFLWIFEIGREIGTFLNIYTYACIAWVVTGVVFRWDDLLNDVRALAQNTRAPYMPRAELFDITRIWGFLTQMNEARFLIERAEEGRIDIRDRHTGRLFSFPISDRKFGTAIGNEYPIDETARGEARSIAQDEARKWGWIDQF